MTDMIQACSNFLCARASIKNTRPNEILRQRRVPRSRIEGLAFVIEGLTFGIERLVFGCWVSGSGGVRVVHVGRSTGRAIIGRGD